MSSNEILSNSVISSNRATKTTKTTLTKTTKTTSKTTFNIRSKRSRIEHFHKIKTKDKKTAPLRFNNCQVNLYNLLRSLKKQGKAIRVRILKPRQVGITTFLANYGYDECVCKRNQFYALLANRWNTVATIFNEIMKFTHDNYFYRLKIKAKFDSRYEISWKRNGSGLRVLTDLHGLTPSFLHVTEVARLARAKERLTEGYQSIGKTGIIIEESTANGRSNSFFDDWEETNDPNTNNGWIAHFIKWWEHEEYTLPGTLEEKTEEEKEVQLKFGLSDGNLLWRRFKIREAGGNRVDIETGLSGIKIFKQNYPFTPEEAFIVSGGSLFDTELLYKMLLQCPQSPSLKQFGAGLFSVYYDKKNTDYVISVDTSEGTGKDFSVATVFDIANLRVVATLRGKYRPKDLAKYICKLGKYYNNALLAVERNNHGHAVLLALEHLEYYNIYIGHDDRKGFNTTSVTRSLILTDLEDAIAGRSIEIKDKQILKECLNFGYNKNGKAEALKGNDDMVMATAIGCHICINSKRRQREIGLSQKPAAM